MPNIAHEQAYTFCIRFITAQCYAERGIAMPSCLSVRPSVCL